jgi:hypothetical protein
MTIPTAMTNIAETSIDQLLFWNFNLNPFG